VRGISLPATESVLSTGEDLPFLEAYDPPRGMFAANRLPRQGCCPVEKSLFQITPAELVSLREQAERMLLRMGVMFNVYGNEAGTERIFPFEVIPQIIDAQTWGWGTLETGLIQRVKALNVIVADIYAERHFLKDGVIPNDLILESSQYRCGAVGIKPPQEVLSRWWALT
jgi:uncharacterized circularly permuted ATP-grasp superfamily protein